jgi:hypothetical protein
MSERYLFTSLTTRIDSVIAAFCRDFSRSAPTVGKPARTVSSRAVSASVSSPASGT